MPDAESDALAVFAFGDDDKVNLRPGAMAPSSRAAPACRYPRTPRCCWPPSPATRPARARPAEPGNTGAGAGRRPRPDRAGRDQARGRRHHQRGGIGHTSSIYARDDAIIERYGAAIRTGRILVTSPTAVGALGGVYNSLAPTFSLGCGTWGGSMTTDIVNYKLAQHQDRVAPQARRTPVPRAPPRRLQRGAVETCAASRWRRARGHRPGARHRGTVATVRCYLPTRSSRCSPASSGPRRAIVTARMVISATSSRHRDRRRSRLGARHHRGAATVLRHDDLTSDGSPSRSSPARAWPPTRRTSTRCS